MRPILPHVYALLPVPLQSLACTADGYRRSLGSFTAYFHATLESWEKRVDDSVDVHHARQWAGLTRLIERARENVPYYRFLPPIVDTGDPVTSVEKTLANIPPLEKAVYRARSRDFVARDVPARRLQRPR